MRMSRLTDEVVRNEPVAAADQGEEFADPTNDKMRAVAARKRIHDLPSLNAEGDMRREPGRFREPAGARAQEPIRRLNEAAVPPPEQRHADGLAVKPAARSTARMPRTRVLEPVELQAYLAAGERLASGSDRALARSLLMTGARHHELTAMKWSELDLGKRLWLRTDKVGLVALLPLSDAMVALLQDLLRAAPPDKGDFVFRPDSPTRSPRSLAKTKAEIDAHMEESIASRPWAWRDLRRSVRALLVWHGLEWRLAREATGSGGRYPVRADDRNAIRAALNRHADVLEAIRRGAFPDTY